MAKDGYTYVQLHTHTADTSACGASTGAEMAIAAKEAGYDVLVITDHFMNANIGCPADMPWPEKVEYLTRGYKSAKEAGDKIGLVVLFGWETFNKGPEYLTYGLGEDFLLANRDIARIGPREYLDRVKAAGGYVIHAHPCRKDSYIPDFVPDTENVDAFEVYNTGNNKRNPIYNDQAYEMAKEHGLIMTAGSDAHKVDSINTGAMRFPMEITDNASLIAAIKSGKGEIIEKL